MKKEAKLLKDKALNSLILSIDHFNRPWNRGRTDAVLLFMDHSFEMFLKAGILHRGGVIRERGEKNTIGFDACVRKAVSSAGIKFLTEEQALTLQMINGLRDAAQHHIVDVSEGHLYLQAQSGVTLHRDLLKSVFSEKLIDHLPERVLPVATLAPTDPIVLFSDEIDQIALLLKPGTRRRTEAKARLRSLAILNGTLEGELLQPSDTELSGLATKIVNGTTQIDELFPGIAAVNFVTEGQGPTITLRIAKNSGAPVKLVAEGTPGATVVAIKRVGDLDYYSLRFNDLSDKLGIGTGTLSALIHVLKIKENTEYSRKVIDTWCYSQKSIDFIRKEMAAAPDKQWYSIYRQDLAPKIEAKRRRDKLEREKRAAERAEAARQRKQPYRAPDQST